ncbi:hypothetical protein ACFFV7_50965 [Nonomuraea spiralis]|uniref:Head-to-tail adaptor n=1 Tax=Nonomuraea spiralis TaxID=46182 RepID=A0ABV5IZZ7_9ACTN|nr:hypothetical protein [Nonomuraea spiralis]GGS88487.1 hypothetical protein GCM10010176_035330 [Nonomuraea spiralis]
MVPYATVADLVPKYLATAPADADLLLERATTVVDDHIMSAVYEVDADGLPVKTELVDALKRAVCEQVAAWKASGVEDGTGAAAQWSNLAIGSASLGRSTSGGGAAGGGSAADCLAPQPAKILRLAGLLGQEPRTYPRCEPADG